MRRQVPPVRSIALPLVALVSVALALGVWLGVGARLPTETEIIEAAAARYVAETGGARTDCAARPADLPGVRLVVICGTSGGADWVEAIDDRGDPVDLDTQQEGPTT